MLEKLFKPSSIAVIGASSVPGKIGYMVLDHLVNQGYQGKIIPVNPKSDKILGLKCYKEVTLYHGSIDMSVITVSTEHVKNAVIKSIDAGVKAIVIITAGFKEVDKAGAELEKEIVDICRKNNVRILGPNVLGVRNTHLPMNASFDFHQLKKGNISVISQSGAICGAIIRWADLKQIGLAKIISIGNKADISEIDILEALEDDEETKVIVGYLESIADGKEFIRAAEKVTQKKPVILFKAGTSSAGMKAASSHTGSLAGADVAYGAAFKRSGVIRAETFEQLYDYATAFSMQPLPKGKSVAIITNAGGLGVICADAVENSGLEVAQLDHQTATALKKKLPNAASVGNVIDVLGDADPERYQLAVKTAMEADSVDAVVALLTVQDLTRGLDIAKVISECTNSRKPLLACFMGGKDAVPALEELVNRNLPDYPSPERMVNALKAMYEYNLWTHREPRVVTRFPVNKRRVDNILNTYRRMDNVQVGEADAKKILNSYDFAIPEGGPCRSAAQAVEMADSIGYPVAMKIMSKDIIHKSDAGGVKINLQNRDAVRDAYDLMMMRISAIMPEAQLDGVYIEQMAPKGREVILGMTRDPQFGPMMMFGLGGVFVEVMKDVAFHLAPITKEEAMQMLVATKSYELLKGIRGRTAVDIDAIATSLQYISQLVTDFPQIMELDINPFIVGNVGGPSMAADARITLSEGWVKTDSKKDESTNSGWRKHFETATTTAENAVKKISPGHRVFIGTAASQPSLLVNAMIARADELVDVEVIQLLTTGDAPYAKKELSNSFKVNSFFITEENIRASISEGVGNYTPIMLLDIPRLFRNSQIPLDVSLIQVSPPDSSGMCSMGISVDVAKAAVENSRLVIAQINPKMPRTLGDSLISIYEIDMIIPADEPIIEVPRLEVDEEEARICENVSSLIENGSTIQLGLGKIPQFCMEYLKDKKDLGIHTDILTEGIVDLVKSGAVTGNKKSLDKGKIVTSFCMGAKKLYDFIDNNEMFSFRRTEYVNDPGIIRQHTKMVAVNTALEIDLTGQVCSDSFGTQFISGIGGQADFIRGANISPKGTSIIAMRSTAKGGAVSKIVAQLTPGAGVVTLRGDVHYVVTEYGTAHLHGKNIQDRTMALISIAHPDYRADLLKKAVEYGYVVPELASVEGKLDKLFVSVRDLTTTMSLDDGTNIKFRPIHPTDVSRMRDLFYRLSKGTVYYRFGWNMKQIAQKQIQDFVFIDHRKEIGIVGTIPSGAEEEIIAFSGYFLDEKTNRSEVALVVQDDWQNRGIGTFMLKYLARVAQKDGIRGFTAEVHTSNKTMQAVMHKLDGKVESVLGGHVFSMKTDFN